MAAAKYPDRNPFPVQATASIEASGREDLSVAITVQTSQLRQSWTVVDNYLRTRSDLKGDSGRALALYGPAGSGKTHSLRYLLARTARQCNEERSLCGQAYVLCGAPNAATLQYSILKEISLEVMRDVSRRFLEVIGLEHLEAKDLETEIGRQEREKLRGNLSQIGELIKSALIDPEDVNRRQSEELRQAGSEDFKNVISYLDDENLGDRARTWLCGGVVNPEDLLRLGVRSKEFSPDHGRDALRILIRLFNRSGSSFIVFLDQCENFLKSEPDGPLLQENVLFLQWLIETLIKEQGLLVVAMNHQIWQVLPAYLRQRFGLNVKSFSILSERDAREFIHTYIQGIPLINEAVPTIFPFEEDGIKQILGSVHGNLRSFLQTCYQAFQIAYPNKQRITSAIVDRALMETVLERPSLDAVVTQIGAVLRDRGLDHSGSYSGRGRASRVIQDRSGRPLALLEVSEALFIDDEAQQSVKTLDVVQEALADPRLLPVIVVVIGYVSPEILGPLRQATPHVLVYERESFHQLFSATLQEVKEASGRGVQPILPLLEGRISELRAELLQLFHSRSQDAQRTTGLAAEVIDKQDQIRIEGLWREARASWSKERKSIEEQIKTARAQRLNEELEALEWDRSRAAKERLQRLALLWSGAGLSIPIWIVASSAVRKGFDITYGAYFLINNISFLVVPLFLAAFGYLIQALGLGGPARALWTKVRSIDELNDLAANLNRRRAPRRPDLFSNNPQLRYAAVRGLEAAPDLSLFNRVLTFYRLVAPVRPWDIRRTIGVEVNPTVRRALSWFIGREDPHDLNIRWPEKVYMIESLGLRYVYLNVLSSSNIKLIDEIHDSDSLRIAYNRGINEETWQALAYRQPVPEIQSVIRRLSPLERPGLGTFDYLKDLPEVDGLYIFLRQWLYFIDLDLPVR